MSNTILEALRQLNLKESNHPINLDYHKKDNKFLDKMWELVSPEYKIHWIETTGDPDTYGCGVYVLLPESDYNDLVRRYPDEDELDENILDDTEYVAFCARMDLRGKVHLYVGLFDEEDYVSTYGEEGKIYNSVEEFVNDYLLV